jgi:hypothetical protein
VPQTALCAAALPRQLRGRRRLDDTGLFHIYIFNANNHPTVCIPRRLNSYNERFRCKIGVIEASRQPILVMSTDQTEPVLQAGIDVRGDLCRRSRSARPTASRGSA